MGRKSLSAIAVAFFDPPHQCHGGHAYVCTVRVGATSLPPQQVLQMLEVMEGQWLGSGYDLVHRICCTFSNDLCIALGVAPIPFGVQTLPGVREAGRHRNLLRLYASTSFSRARGIQKCSHDYVCKCGRTTRKQRHSKKTPQNAVLKRPRTRRCSVSESCDNMS